MTPTCALTLRSKISLRTFSLLANMTFSTISSAGGAVPNSVGSIRHACLGCGAQEDLLETQRCDGQLKHEHVVFAECGDEDRLVAECALLYGGGWWERRCRFGSNDCYDGVDAVGQ
ncbi:hypothetical protein HD806DRAFT_51232 [Xylariaceae sp. AK1471]|nr:hypothetical protein HD806DRAFT_51232 [Xylariaceae sp. AK1471]